jgi:hypothetical protein
MGMNFDEYVRMVTLMSTPKPKIKVIKQDLPLESWKMVFVTDKAQVLSGFQLYPMDLSDEGMKASCNINAEHTAPQEGCDCGFWSWETLDLTQHKAWLASVANAGRIEVGDGRMRAEWQRVLALYPGNLCHMPNCTGEVEDYALSPDQGMLYVIGVCHTHARLEPELVDRQSLQELISVPIVWPIPKPSLLRPNPAYQDSKSSDKVAEGEGWNAVGLPIEFVQSCQPGYYNTIVLPINGQGFTYAQIRFHNTDKGIELEFEADGQYIHRCMINATRSIAYQRRR